MFKAGFLVQTPYGKGVVVAAKNRTNTEVRIDATWEVLTIKSEFLTAVPEKVADTGWWLPAKAGQVKVGQQIMTIDGQIGTVTRPDGKAWVFTTCKPSNLQIYALRVFVPDADAYIAQSEDFVNFASFQPVKEDAIWASHWAAWESKFASTHSKAIANYCGSWYETLNRQLRKGKAASTIPYCDRLDAALGMGMTERDMIVWRAGSRKFDVTIPVGSTFSDKGFGSCTIRRRFSESWGAGVLFEIRVPKGTRGGYVGNVSQHRDEKEFILPRNAMYRVVSISKPANGRPLVVCDLVGQG